MPNAVNGEQMMERPKCLMCLKNQECKPMLKRKWKHIGWFCVEKRQWIITADNKIWHPHSVISEYLKPFGKTIEDIPEVEP